MQWNMDHSRHNIGDVAAGYDALPKFDPKAAYAWQHLAEESKKHADYIRKHLNVTETDNPEPYDTSEDMIRDIRNNRNFVVSTANADHPIWTPQDNINFRIVHDVFGHAATEGDFGWHGENDACSTHFALSSPHAQKALATECLGQTGYAIDRGGFTDQRVGFIPGLHEGLAAANEDTPIPTQAQLIQRALYGPPKQSKWKIAESQDANRMYRQHTDGTPVAETTFESIQNEDTSEEHEDEDIIVNGKKWKKVRRKNNPQPDTYKDPIGGWGFYSKLLDKMEKQPWTVVSVEKATPIDVDNIGQYQIPRSYKIVDQLVPHFARYGVIPIARKFSNTIEGAPVNELPEGGGFNRDIDYTYNHNIHLYDPEIQQIVYGMEYSLNHPDAFEHHSKDEYGNPIYDNPEWAEQEFYEHKYPTYVNSIHYNQPGNHEGANDIGFHEGGRIYLSDLDEKGKPTALFGDYQETVDYFNKRYPRLSLSVLRWMQQNLPKPIGADIINPKLREKAQKQDFVSLSKWKFSVPPAEKAEEYAKGYEKSEEPDPEYLQERYKWNPEVRGHRWKLNYNNLERAFNHPDFPVKGKYNVFTVDPKSAPTDDTTMKHWKRTPLGTHEAAAPNKAGSIHINPLISAESANEALWHELQHAYQDQEGRFTPEMREKYFDPTDIAGLSDEEVERRFKENYLEHPMEIDANKFADFMREYPLIEESEPIYKSRWVNFSMANKDVDEEIKSIIDRYYEEHGSKRRLPLPSIESKWKIAGETRTKLLERASQLPEDTSEIVHEFDDGWTIRKVKKFKDLYREGTLMSNCVGLTDPILCGGHNPWQYLYPDLKSLDPDLEKLFTPQEKQFIDSEMKKDPPLPEAVETWLSIHLQNKDPQRYNKIFNILINKHGEKESDHYYSLRDSDNIPHVTMGNGSGSNWEEKGRHNSEVKDKYFEYLNQWQKSFFPSRFSYKKWSIKKEAPARSKAQFRYMQGICNGSIEPPEGMTRAQACEYVEGQSSKGLPEKKSKWYKKSNYLDGYHSAVIYNSLKGYPIMKYGKNESVVHGDVSGFYTHRGLYNPTTGHLIHMTNPSEYEKVKEEWDKRMQKGGVIAPEYIIGKNNFDSSPEEHRKTWLDAAKNSESEIPIKRFSLMYHPENAEDKDVVMFHERLDPELANLIDAKEQPQQLELFDNPSSKQKDWEDWDKENIEMKISNSNFSKLDVQQDLEKILMKQGFSEKGAILMALDYMSKLSYWMDGYHAAVALRDPETDVWHMDVGFSDKLTHGGVTADYINDLGTKAMRESVSDKDSRTHYYNHHTARGLYNPVTKDFIHMSHPDFWDETDYNFKSLDQDERDRMEAFWRQLAEQTGIELDSIRVLNNQTGHLEDMNIADLEMPEEVERARRMYERNRPLNPWERERGGYDTKTGKTKTSHWIKGYNAAIINQDGKMEIAESDPDRIYYDDDDDDDPTEEWHLTHWDIGGMPRYRGLYNPKTRDLIHMTSPEEYHRITDGEGEWYDFAENNRPEYPFEEEAINPEGHKDVWANAAKEAGIPVDSVRLMYADRNQPRKNYNKQNDETDFNIKTAHWIQGFHAAIINQNGKMEVAPQTMQILDSEGNVIEEDDTPWYATHWDIGGYPQYRGIYNHDTGELIHMTSPEEHEKLRAMGSEYLDSTDDAVNPLEHETIWRNAAKESNIPINDFKLLYEKEEDEYGDEPPYKRWSDPMNQKEDFRLVDPEEFMPKQSKWKKRGHWLEGYHAAVITPKGEMKVAKDWHQFHGSLLPDAATLARRGFHRGLYNPETGQLLHMTTPEEWKKLEDSWGSYEEEDPDVRWPLGFEWIRDPKDFVSPYKTEKEWLKAAESSEIPVSEVKFFSGEPEVNPFTAFDVNNFNLHSPQEIAAKYGKWKKQSHWIEGFHSAIINQNGEMEVAPPGEDNWLRTHWDIGGYPKYRGLYNHDTGQLIHMTSPEEHDRSLKGKLDDRPEYLYEQESFYPEVLLHQKAWELAAKKSNIPVNKFSLLYAQTGERSGQLAKKWWRNKNKLKDFRIEDPPSSKNSKWKISKKDVWEAVLDGELGHDIITTGTWEEVKKQTIKWLKQLKNGYINKKNPHDNKKIDAEAREQDAHALEDLKLYEEKKRWSFHFDHGKHPYDLIIQPVGYKESKWKISMAVRGRPLSSDQINQLIKDYKTGMSLDEVARKNNLNRITVRKYLILNNIDRRGPKSPRVKIRQKELEKRKQKNNQKRNYQRNKNVDIINDYIKGVGISELAFKNNVDHKTIRRVLLRNNIPLNTTPRTPKIETPKIETPKIETPKIQFNTKNKTIYKILDLYYNKNKNIQEIGNEFNQTLSQQNIRNIIKQYGLKQSKWKKRSHWVEGFHAAGITPEGEMVVGPKWTTYHGELKTPNSIYKTFEPHAGWRGLYNPETRELLHLTDPEEYNRFQYTETAEELEDFKHPHEHYRDVWQKAADKTGYPVDSIHLFIDPEGTADPAKPNDKKDFILPKIGKWKKRSHWMDGYHAAVISEDGEMFVADDPYQAHVQSMPENMISDALTYRNFWRGLYHPETHTILHMSTPQEYKELRSEGSEIAPSHSGIFKEDHDYYDEEWREAAKDAGIPVKDVKLLKWNFSQPYPSWENDRYPNNPEQFIIQDLNLRNKYSKWKISDKKKRKIHPKFQTSLKDHQRSVRKYGPLKTHKVRNFKKKSVLSEEQGKELFEYEPYMYHDVAAARTKAELKDQIDTVRSILNNGILPKEQTGVVEYDDWLTSRPDHVYIGREGFYPRTVPPAIRINMSKVDPSTLKPDEDIYHAFGFSDQYKDQIDMHELKSVPFEEEHRNNPDYTLGQWMEDHSHLDTPKNVLASYALNNSLAVHGGVPADALEINPKWVDHIKDRHGIDITKML